MIRIFRLRLLISHEMIREREHAHPGCRDPEPPENHEGVREMEGNAGIILANREANGSSHSLSF